MTLADAARWNHNIHYHRLILDAAPPGCARALDVGCGDGMLARQLRTVAEQVTAIDLDVASLDRARAEADERIDYVLGDVRTQPFAPASFDLVASVAMLHHVDAEAGLARMAELVRPGGVVAVVGLACSRGAADLALDIAAVVATRAYRLRRGFWEHGAPTVWPPPHTYAELATIARRVLPGVRYRRHLLWRYSLVWTRRDGL